MIWKELSVFFVTPVMTSALDSGNLVLVQGVMHEPMVVLKPLFVDPWPTHSVLVCLFFP